jgi:hypothetical protein
MARFNPSAMLLMVLALTATLLAPAAASALLAAAGASVALQAIAGACPLLNYADLCGCRSSVALVHSYNLDGTFEGPRMTLDDKNTGFEYGSYCAVSMFSGRRTAAAAPSGVGAVGGPSPRASCSLNP